MEKDKGKKHKRKMLIVEAVVVALIIGIVAFVVAVLSYDRKAWVTEEHEDFSLVTMVCSRHDDEHSFFENNNASDKEHQLKIVFKDDKIDKISYGFEGEYDSKESADHDDAVLHADYNIYMSNHEISSELLTPIFRVSDNKLFISMYLENYSSLNSVTGKIFYIGSGDIDKLAKNSVDDVKAYFKKKGFSCTIKD